jgi:hypothetical protein
MKNTKTELSAYQMIQNVNESIAFVFNTDELCCEENDWKTWAQMGR